MTPGEYARYLMKTHEEEKMLVKMNKEREKKTKLLQETRFGVTPSPSKSALNRVRATPGSISKTPRSTRRFNTSQASLISVIEPTIPPTVSGS